jgi:nitronate monooxygenase
MGVGVSGWKLARTVAQYGQLGVVSGTYLEGLITRRLQDGDMDGAIRKAFSRFPHAEIAKRVIQRFYVEGGKDQYRPYKLVPRHSLASARELTELTILCNFAEVYLAREGHNGLVGINYLSKIELPTLASLYGAMLAGVDFVLMGAGIPRAIPGILDGLSQMQRVRLRLDVKNCQQDDCFEIDFDPLEYNYLGAQNLKRPNFLAVVSSPTLAQALVKKGSGKIDGFVVEHHTAGGHNAPPRGTYATNLQGEPSYGPRDECDPAEFRKIGVPFWWAGSCASPEKLKEALAFGAAGIQVGTAFAFCRESGIKAEIKEKVIAKICSGNASVKTDPLASSSGFPFKVLDLENSVSKDDVYHARSRICDIGYFRSAYKKNDGSVGFRCPAEPAEDYERKGGNAQDTIGRKCLCNGLLATVGYAQVQEGNYLEPALVTAGKDVSSIGRFILEGQSSYSAIDVLDVLLSEQKAVLSANKQTNKQALTKT